MNQITTSTGSIQTRVDQLSTQRPDDRTIIVAYGLMNAGKSFLLNMLTQHIEEEFFKTNDIRETAEVKKFEYERYVYLDTPGLDANEGDDAQAQLGASQADVVLFLHQPQGELEVNEVKFLKELKQSFGSCANSNIILILSKIEKEEQWKINQIEGAIKDQCIREIGFSPKVFKVSNKRYQTGILKQKGGLIAQSHINPLIDHINLVASSTLEVRRQRMLAESESLLQMINERENSLKNRKKSIHNLIEKSFSVFNNHVSQLNKFLENSASQYRSI